ncbi:serine/threonine-protein kinase [Kitasatospora cathayae]|uniref:non-specific serine/threonine protein kinase n=1 Tax=Kitasatospora cathayae TaxID=3004092 RepID=A0ABY7PW38_9ACTN|nr:serine/threonine-protein kinase [Kitasatospora sp. HUAS 3-15]WBP84657.1 serine/threonine-protein kinase [Kitasatospora sp. HUAS 3-15]
MTDPGEAAAGTGATGMLINGRYRLLERLGQGGMGTVWRATDERMRRQVALKEPVLPDGIDDQEREERLRRMEREAQAAAALRHPNIVRMYDIESVDGRPWLVMELIEGESLEAILATGTLSVPEAAEIGCQIAAALAAVHAAGVVHRDIKPANIMRARTGETVLTDFGIAQIDGGTDLTRTGVVVGSIPYLSPERAAGQRPGPAADLWALGVLLYEAVEGVHPYRRQHSQSTLAAILTDPVPQPRRTGALTVPIMSLLERDPARRPNAAQTQLLLAGAAATAQSTQPVPTVLDTPAATALLPAALTLRLRAAGEAVTATRRRTAVALGVAVAVIAGATAWALWPAGAPSPASIPVGYKAQQVASLGFAVAVPQDYVASIGSDDAAWASPDGRIQIDLRDEGKSTQDARAYAQKRLDTMKADHSKPSNCGDSDVPDPFFTTPVHDPQSMLHGGGVNASVIEYDYSAKAEEQYPCIASSPNDKAIEQYMIHEGHVLHLAVNVRGYYKQQADGQKADYAVYENVNNSLKFG